MAIPVYSPGLKVSLFKMVARRGGDAERYTSAEREIDLTPYLGEAGAVRTVKDLQEPAGSFTLAFADKPHPRALDSLYAMIEPMDMVEIRAAREPHRFAGQPLPLIMRGFVSQIRRPEAMDQAGDPQRMVVVQGHDFGKLWLVNHVLLQIAQLESPLLTVFALQEAYGIGVRPMRVADFMRELTEKVVNRKIREMAPFAAPRQVEEFRVEATVRRGTVIPQAVAAIRAGPIWNIAETFADRPWNELYVEDRGEPGQEVPTLIFRPSPYRDLSGEWTMPEYRERQATPPETIALDIEAVVSLDLHRSDARVANVFYVPPGYSTLDTSASVSTATLQSGQPLDFQHPNNRPELFGQRMLQAPTALVPDLLTDLPYRLPEAERAAANREYVLWHEALAQLLKLMNRDNSVFEDGGAVVRGAEILKPGRYLRLTRGDLVSEAYITQVAHNFAPLQAWTTSLRLERGAGFYGRNRFAGSPYLAEGFRGPYG